MGVAETLQLVKEEWWDQLFELIEFIQEHFPSDAAEADFDWDPDNFEEDIGVSIFDEYSRYRPLLADVHGYMTNLLARFGRSNDEMLEDEYGDTFILSEVPYLDFYMDRDINSLPSAELKLFLKCLQHEVGYQGPPIMGKEQSTDQKDRKKSLEAAIKEKKSRRKSAAGKRRRGGMDRGVESAARRARRSNESEDATDQRRASDAAGTRDRRASMTQEDRDADSAARQARKLRQRMKERAEHEKAVREGQNNRLTRLHSKKPSKKTFQSALIANRFVEPSHAGQSVNFDPVLRLDVGSFYRKPGEDADTNDEADGNDGDDDGPIAEPVNKCKYCKALRFDGEPDSICCGGGKVHLPPLPEDPEPFRYVSYSFRHLIFCNTAFILSHTFTYSHPNDYMCRATFHGSNTIQRCARASIRALGSGFQMSSVKKHEISRARGGNRRWNPNIMIEGQTFYRVGPMSSEPGADSRYMQTYAIHDPQMADARRWNYMSIRDNLTVPEQNILLGVLPTIRGCLETVNPFVRDLKSIFEVWGNGRPVDNRRFVLTEKDLPSNSGPRTYGSRNLSEVMLLSDDDALRNTRDFVLFERVPTGDNYRGIRNISDTHRAADPLAYPLLFPHGTHGWSPDLLLSTPSNEPDEEGNYTFQSKTRGGRGHTRLTGTHFSRYYMQCRERGSKMLLYGGRLRDEWVLVNFIKAERQKLEYLRHNQTKLRAHNYSVIADQVEAGDVVGADGARTGTSVVLPSSFLGGPRDMQQRYQDALAICSQVAAPAMFITMTANPNCEEVKQAIAETTNGLGPTDRADIVARVFEQKKQALLTDLEQNGIFGRRVGIIAVIEFQARGLPHCHIVLMLHPDDKFKSAEEVDQFVCAELPRDWKLEDDPAMKEDLRRLEALVVNNMVHGPGCDVDPTAPCRFDKSGSPCDTCQKHYPKDFRKETECDPSLGFTVSFVCA